MHLVVVGGPLSGKTTTANLISAATGVRVMHTDSIVHEYAWSEQSELIASEWFDADGDWIIEGVAAVRALRKRLRATPDVAPCERVLVLTEPFHERTVRQEAMGKSVATVFAEILPDLKRVGVHIVEYRQHERPAPPPARLGCIPPAARLESKDVAEADDRSDVRNVADDLWIR